MWQQKSHKHGLATTAPAAQQDGTTGSFPVTQTSEETGMSENTGTRASEELGHYSKHVTGCMELGNITGEGEDGYLL